MSDSRSVRVRVLLGHLVEDGARVHNAGTILRVSPRRAEELAGEGKVELVEAGPRPEPSRGELRTRRGMRAAPFLAVALCFLLPFFSAASCGGGVSTSVSATGVDIVTGARLVVHRSPADLCVNTDPSTCPPPVRLGVGPDPVAQGVADAAQPWAITALVLVLAGAFLVVVADGFWRAASLITAAAAFVALLRMGNAFHARGADISWETGSQLAIFILLVTIIWVGVLAIKAAQATLATTPVSVGSAIQGLDLRRRRDEPASGETDAGA